MVVHSLTFAEGFPSTFAFKMTPRIFLKHLSLVCKFIPPQEVGQVLKISPITFLTEFRFRKVEKLGLNDKLYL
jgi:hypothetical protein